jgi:hypothetical protein
MKRPTLNKIELKDWMQPAGVVLTMSEKQWDGLLEAAYDDGATLLELDKRENPIAAYRKPSITN